MPANDFGYVFAPTFDNAQQGLRGGTPATQAQRPLQVLSFSLPKFKGAAGGLSPLQGTAPTSVIGSAVLQSVLKTVLGPEADSLLGQLPGAPPPTPMDGFTPPPVQAPAPTPGTRVPVPGAVPTPIDTGRIGDTVRGPGMPTVRPNPPTVQDPEPEAPMSMTEPERRNPFPDIVRDPIPEAPRAVAPPPPVIRPGGDKPTAPLPPSGGEDNESSPAPPRFRIPDYKLPVLFGGSGLDVHEPFVNSGYGEPPAFSRFRITDWL